MSAPSEVSLLTHYKVLGLPYTATESDIKKAYRKLAIKLHPDKNPHLAPEVASARFHPIQLAYDVLLDPASRAAASERAQETAAREERMAAFSGKRKEAAEELEREEGRWKEKRRREMSAKEEREAKLARLKEEGRRKVEEREGEVAAAASAAAAANSKGQLRSDAATGAGSRAGWREDLHTAGSVPTASERAAAAAASSSSRKPTSTNTSSSEDPAQPAARSATAPSIPGSGPGTTAKTPVFSFKTFAASASTRSGNASGSGSGSGSGTGSGVGAPPPKFSFQPGKRSTESVGR